MDENFIVSSEHLASSSGQSVVRKQKCLQCDHPKKPLFRVPNDYNRLSTWLRILHKEFLLDIHSLVYLRNNARVCCSHFGEEAFTSTLRQKLNKFAVPLSPDMSSSERSVPPCVLADITSVISNEEKVVASVSGITDAVHRNEELFKHVPSTLKSSCLITPKTKKIKKLQTDICKLKKRLFKAEKTGILHNLKSSLTSLQYDFVMSQITAVNKDPRGRRWSPKQKAMALNIYYHSPSAYRVLRKSFAFPSKTTIRRSTGQIAKDDGFCPILVGALKEYVLTLKPEEKLCTLVFDEIATKTSLNYNAAIDRVDGYESAERLNSPPQFATQALVFMIRGVTQNWKQVVAYYFRANSSPELWFQETVLNVLDLVVSIGFRVIATVCDQGPVNQALYRGLRTTSELPYFERNGCKIFTIYDTPHLLKSVRNNLKNYNVEFTEPKECNDRKTLIASWSHIVEFYECDKVRKYKIAPNAKCSRCQNSLLIFIYFCIVCLKYITVNQKFYRTLVKDLFFRFNVDC